MAHQCVRCNKIYPDASNEILKGCSDCGGKFFFFIKKEALEQVKEATSQLTIEDKPIILDLASVNILKPGKFELDLVRLFKGEPMVYRLDEGKYIIDIAETFKNVKNSLIGK